MAMVRCPRTRKWPSRMGGPTQHPRDARVVVRGEGPATSGRVEPVRIGSLIICDDAASYRRVLRLLIDGDHRWELVAEAANGREAIDLVREHRPDLLLLDVSMPVLTGTEALPQIREASPDTRVVLLTGYLGPEVLADAERNDVAEVVDKATGLPALRAVLDRYADG